MWCYYTTSSVQKTFVSSTSDCNFNKVDPVCCCEPFSSLLRVTVSAQRPRTGLAWKGSVWRSLSSILAAKWEQFLIGGASKWRLAIIMHLIYFPGPGECFVSTLSWYELYWKRAVKQHLEGKRACLWVTDVPDTGAVLWSLGLASSTWCFLVLFFCFSVRF